MDFTPSEEQGDARHLAGTIFATAQPAELALPGFDSDLWSRLGESGLLGIAVPDELGGGGCGLAEAQVIAEECGRVAGRLPLVPVLAALHVLVAAGRPGDTELIDALVEGRSIVVPALTEAGVGDSLHPTVIAHRAADGWELRGTRLAVAWAREASHLLLAARTEDGGTVLVLLPTSTPGLTLQDEEVSSREPHATVVLDGVHVTDADVLAGADRPDALESALTWLTLLQCAHAIGVGETALKMAAEHVTEREQFGRPLATFQGVTMQVADCWIDVEAMRLTMQQAVWRVDQGLPAAEQTAVAAYWAASAVHRVVETAVHLHGGLGVDVSYPLHRWYLAGKVDELSLGGAARQLDRLGDLLAAR